MSEAENQQATHEHWMREALKLAQQAEALGEVPVGALVVKDGEVIGQGYNQPISSHDPSAHAEIVALRDAAQRLGNYRLVDCTLYVTIEPCSMCAGALVHSRIKQVIYGAPEPKAGVVTSNGCFFDQPYLNHRVVSGGGVLADECSRLISNFFAGRRKR